MCGCDSSATFVFGSLFTVMMKLTPATSTILVCRRPSVSARTVNAKKFQWEQQTKSLPYHSYHGEPREGWLRNTPQGWPQSMFFIKNYRPM